MAITTLDKKSCFYYNICGSFTERQIQSKWNILSYDHRSILEKYILETIELFDFELLRFWLWPSTLRDRFIVPFESLYLTSHLSSIDIFPPYRTVLKMIDFKALRVWPWPLTSKSHLRSKYVCYSKAHTSLAIWLLLTFNLVQFLRYLVSKFSRFNWPWSLTSKDHLGSEIFSPFERPYMTSYLTSSATFSLSRTVFEIFDFKVFRVWPLTFRDHLGQKYFHHWKPHTWLPIYLLLTLSLYLMPFSRYLTLTFITFITFISIHPWAVHCESPSSFIWRGGGGEGGEGHKKLRNTLPS